MRWYVYLLQCSDGTFYCGITTDLADRVARHNSGKGAKYTRSRLPVYLLYSEPAENRSAAAKREWVIKGMSRKEKLDLIAND